jgi:hypothetical protein
MQPMRAYFGRLEGIFSETHSYRPNFKDILRNDEVP